MHQICRKSLYCHTLCLAQTERHLKTCAHMHTKILCIHTHTPTKSMYCICSWTTPPFYPLCRHIWNQRIKTSVCFINQTEKFLPKINAHASYSQKKTCSRLFFFCDDLYICQRVASRLRKPREKRYRGRNSSSSTALKDNEGRYLGQVLAERDLKMQGKMIFSVV